MSYWYLAQDDELLIDLDEAMRDTSKGPWIEIYFRRRLREAIIAHKLVIRSVYLTRSATAGHFNAVVRLVYPSWYPHLIGLTQWKIEKLVWQFYLGSDLYRARADLMRAVKGYSYPSLLILPEKIPQFYRDPDAECTCTHKHTLHSKCPTYLLYRGPEMTEMFGPLSKGKEQMVPLPIGNVPLGLILEVRK